jgi:hypothetical protein
VLHNKSTGCGETEAYAVGTDKEEEEEETRDLAVVSTKQRVSVYSEAIIKFTKCKL